MCNLGNQTGRILHVSRNRPIIAWRWWALVDRSTLRLDSIALTGSLAWAKRLARADRVPTRPNSNGLHAYKTRKQAEADKPYWLSYGRTPVLGRVALWGKLVEHEDGYRAEFARVVTLDQAGQKGELRYAANRERLREIRKAYKLKASAASRYRTGKR